MANLGSPPDPNAGPPSDTPGPGSAPPGVMDALGAQHDNTSALFDKMEAGKKTLETVRGAMDKLVAMGNAVTADDVIEMGGTLVGAGLSPQAVAQQLSSLPQGSDAIAQWVQQQDQQVSAREAQMEQAHAATQHHMGVNALRLIAGHHLGGDAGLAAGAAPGAAPGPAGPSAGGPAPGALGLPS